MRTFLLRAIPAVVLLLASGCGGNNQSSAMPIANASGGSSRAAMTVTVKRQASAVTSSNARQIFTIPLAAKSIMVDAYSGTLPLPAAHVGFSAPAGSAPAASTCADFGPGQTQVTLSVQVPVGSATIVISADGAACADKGATVTTLSQASGTGTATPDGGDIGATFFGTSGGVSLQLLDAVPSPVASASPTDTLQPPAGASSVSTSSISANLGGAITLADGSAAALMPGALAHDSVIQFADIPNLQEDPSGPNVTQVGPVLQLVVGGPATTPPMSGNPTGNSTAIASFSLPVSGELRGAFALQSTDRSSEGTRRSESLSDVLIPIIRIYDSITSSLHTDIAPDFSYDPTTSRVTVMLPVAPLHLEPGSRLEMLIMRATPPDSPCGVKGRFSPGLRTFDTSTQTWKIGPPATQANHTLLLVHGIFSCVEQPFSSTAINRFIADGSYDTVIGYDYDWSQSPETVAPQIAAAVNGVKPFKLDIFAHSYGTVVTMATIPLLSIPTVDNLALYGGPLNGAFIDNPEIYRTLFTASPSYIGIASGLNLAKLLTEPEVKKAAEIFTPNNARLVGIKLAMVSSGKVSRVIKVAGTVPFSHSPDGLYRLITGGNAPTNDGIVATTSAEDPMVRGTQPKATVGYYDTVDVLTSIHEFAKTHIELPADSAVEAAVAPDLAFEFVGGLAGLRLGPVSIDSEGDFIMKGIGSRSHEWLVGPNGVTLTLDPNSLTGHSISCDHFYTEITNGEASEPRITCTVIANPTSAVAVANGVAQPTVTIQEQAQYPRQPPRPPVLDKFFILPPCTSCLGTGLQSVQSAPNSLHERASLLDKRFGDAARSLNGTQ